MSTTITKYLKLGRITSWPAFSLSFLIPFAVGAYEGTDWARAILGFVVLILIASFSFALNFYSDRDSDRYHDGMQKDMNLTRQPVLTGEVTLRECKVFCAVTVVLIVILAFLVSNLFALLTLLACLLGGVLYSHPFIRLKTKPIFDIACMCLCCALLFSAGYTLARETMVGWLAFVFFFQVCVVLYISTVVQDYEWDVQAGLRTSAVVFGKRKLTNAMWAVCVTMIPVTWLIVSGPYAIAFKTCAVLFLVSSVVYTILSWRALNTPRYTLPLLDRFPHATMITAAILALMCLGYAFSKVFVTNSLP
ncbi:MAG: hypothetical protein FJ004_10390 [Chloroflexi bacterium]|nr:hypothetical protein [Chloroflexota bacterium]